MNIEQLRDFCLSQNGATESFPFNDDLLVFKVLGKMFLMVSLSKWEAGECVINLKCDPEKAIILRETYQGIIPGWHMNKKHWNTVTLNSLDVFDDFANELIKHSYDQVLKTFSKKALLSIK